MRRTKVEEQLERAGGDGGELSAGRLRMGMNGHGGGETSTKKAKANAHTFLKPKKGPARKVVSAH